METQCVTVTASQLNRAAVEEIEFDHSHISGGLSKIMTADNVIGIFTSRAMKERGRYQIQFMKTRSSSGVGQKVELEFNVDTLRITDLGEDEESHSFSQQKSQSQSTMLNGFKRTSVVSTSANAVSEHLDVSSAPWANRDNPKEGLNLEKPRAKASTGPMIRNMLSNLNPEKD